MATGPPSSYHKILYETLHLTNQELYKSITQKNARNTIIILFASIHAASRRLISQVASQACMGKGLSATSWPNYTSNEKKFFLRPWKHLWYVHARRMREEKQKIYTLYNFQFHFHSHSQVVAAFVFPIPYNRKTIQLQCLLPTLCEGHGQCASNADCLHHKKLLYN